MPSIQRPLSGNVMVLKLDQEKMRTADPDILRRSGRSARTLFKQGPLRATLVVLAPGGALEEHHAPGPITVQPLEGRIVFTVEGEGHDLAPGDLLTLAAGVPHSVSSEDGASFLLTNAQPGVADE